MFTGVGCLLLTIIKVIVTVWTIIREGVRSKSSHFFKRYRGLMMKA